MSKTPSKDGGPQPQVRPAFKKTEFKKRPELADKYHQALLKDPAGLAYLRSRRISQETAGRFCLGLEQDKGSVGCRYPISKGAGCEHQIPELAAGGKDLQADPRFPLDPIQCGLPPRKGGDFHR